MVARRKCQGRCGKTRQESSYPSPKARICKFCQRSTRRAGARSRHLEGTYEITQVEYDAILKLQFGRCAGCSQARTYNLPVDHDHKLEREQGSRASVRGLLCKRCNKVLAMVGDSADILLLLADYLESPPARRVLGETTPAHSQP